MNALGLGRIVHVRIGGTEEAPTLRPAIVVRVWDDHCANVQLFTDVENDRCDLEASAMGVRVEPCVWVTSVTEGPGIRQFRWPVRG